MADIRSDGGPPTQGAPVFDSKETGHVNADENSHSGSDSDEPLNKNIQAGVRDMEATTTIWTKQSLILAYVMIWIIYFVNTMQQGVTSTLTPWVTSAFEEHSLTPTVNILSNIIGGLSKLTLAKIVDVFGRPQGYLLSIVLTTLGLVMMAACNNVQTYAAAQVFYWVGYNNLDYCLSIFIADTSSLKNRGLMFAFASSPYIITTWLGGPISQAFLHGPGFRWGFGAFAIITPVVTLPLYALFMKNYLKAKSQGLIAKRKTHDMGYFRAFYYYAVQFDIVAIIMLSGGLALFLLSFNLYQNQPGGWDSPLIICFLVFGVVLIACFCIWEARFAPVKFLPYDLFTDRTVIGACCLAGSVFISWYIWDSYFLSFLQVVNNLNVTESSYVANIYTVGSCFWSVVVGLLIRYTGRFKWLALYFGVPVTMLGVGLMIHFRQPGVDIGYIVMCQIFIAFAGGTIVICEQTAIMAASPHQYVAVVLAIESMFSYIGGAVGLTVAGAIWQGVFPQTLGKHLPAETRGNLSEIYGSLGTQLSYPVGSATRTAIQLAYGDAQRIMLIAATCMLVVPLVSVMIWRDIKVKDRKQVAGLVI